VIYVDSLKLKKRQFYCHMVSDISIAELHWFALKCGVPRHWFHKDHYDLRSMERSKAVAEGAVETDTRTVARVRVK
jgi:hypothetical protein